MAVAEDLDKGITDRLKSLPVARLALLGGRALGELAIIAWGIVVTAGLGFLVGFRLHGSAQEALLAIVVGLVCGFAFLWLFICLGLASGNAQAAQGIGFMIYPFMFISSAYIPVYTLPNWMQPLRREPARQRHGQRGAVTRARRSRPRRPRPQDRLLGNRGDDMVSSDRRHPRATRRRALPALVLTDPRGFGHEQGRPHDCATAARAAASGGPARGADCCTVHALLPEGAEMLLLEGKTAIVYGGGGAIGGAAAQVFAREGARVHLAGRTPATLDAVAKEIRAAGGTVEVAGLDALDESVVREHADAVAAASGGIDVALNAIGITHVQGVPFTELSLDDFLHPITAHSRGTFITAQAVARHMVGRGSGVILTMSTSGSRLTVPGTLGYSTTCAAIEAMTRLLAAELGPSGVRVVCLQPEMIPEAGMQGSHSRVTFQPWADRLGVTMDEFLAAPADRTLLKRWPTLADVAEAAAFVASDRAAATTGTVVNITAGSVVG